MQGATVPTGDSSATTMGPDQVEAGLVFYPHFATKPGELDQARARPAPAWEPCPVCHGLESVIEDRNGIDFAVPCRCVKLRRAATRYNAARFLPKFHDATVENTDWTTAPLRKLRPRVEAFIADFEPGRAGLLFVGGPGQGKTRIAHVLGRGLVLRGRTVAFRKWAGVLADLKDAYAQEIPESEVVARYMQPDLFIADDIGQEQKTEWSHVAMERILGERLEAGRTTVITSNLGADEKSHDLREWVGDRVYSRMLACNVVRFTGGPDYRGKR